MIKNFFIVAFRNLFRKKTYTLVNLFGLSVSLGACIMGYLAWEFGYHFDQFHEKVDRIYHVATTREVTGRDQIFAASPLPLGPALVSDIHGIRRAVRYAGNNSIVRYKDKVFNETVHYADDGFFDMFSFGFEKGNASFLKDKNSVLLTHEMAVKYFGDDDPVGQRLTLTYDQGRKRDFVVAAILKPIPRNSSLYFGFLISSEVLVDMGIDEPNNWAHVTASTFIEVDDPGVIEAIKNRESEYVGRVRSANPRFAITHLVFTPLKDIALAAEEFRGYNMQYPPPVSARISIFIISILLLVMACFNYMNTSLAIAAGRLKEIGIRKVLGSARGQLIAQFLVENLILCFLALVAAFGVAELLVSGWNALFIHIRFSIEDAWNIRLIVFLGVLLGLTALGGGLYPAYVISSYNPASILQGHQARMKANWIIRVMLTIQFSISMIGVVGSIVFSQNAEYQKNLDLGYDEDRLIVVPLPTGSMFPTLENEFRQNPLIENVAGSRNHLSFSVRRREIKMPDKNFEAEFLYVGPGYPEVLGLRLAEGRFHDRNLKTDLSESVVINRTMAVERGWDNPIGKTLTIDSVTCRVIGVIEDIYIRGPFFPILPTILIATPETNYQFAVVRANADRLMEAMGSIETTWKKLFPELPFEAVYHQTRTEEPANISSGIKMVFLCVALMAVVISGMGLSALVSLNIVRRTKEIGIRKVLGATELQIFRMMNTDFVLLLVIASFIADVAGYFATHALLDSIYRYHVEVTVVALVAANMAVFILGIMTIGMRVWKVAWANPVQSLRYE